MPWGQKKHVCLVLGRFTEVVFLNYRTGHQTPLQLFQESGIALKLFLTLQVILWTTGITRGLNDLGEHVTGQSRPGRNMRNASIYILGTGVTLVGLRKWTPHSGRVSLDKNHPQPYFRFHFVHCEMCLSHSSTSSFASDFSAGCLQYTFDILEKVHDC